MPAPKQSPRRRMKVGNYLSPLPATLLSSAIEGERPNIMTVAWNGTVCSDPPMISVSVTKARYSHHLLVESGEFVINVPDLALAKATDFCGVKSFRDCDKFEELKLTPVPMEGLEFAPAIAEAPLSLGCKIRKRLELGSHDLFIGEIVHVLAREDLIDDKGALHLEDSGLFAYVHGQYYELGDWLGFFGWSVAKPDVLSRRRREARSRLKKTRIRTEGEPIRKLRAKPHKRKGHKNL